MSHFVDLHSHVLPGIDDGARDLGQTRQMLELLAAAGFEIVCATPHQKAAQFLPSREAIDEAYAAALGTLAPGSSLELRLGAENYWDEVFFARAHERTIPCYTGDKAFLVEIPPQQTPLRFEDHLFSQRTRGLLPVLAHPERYGDLVSDLERIETIGKTAALVVDLGALDGAHGKRESKAARKLLLEGLVHAVASDIHAPEDMRAAAAGMAWIRKKLDDRALTRLLEENPRRILSGEHPG